MAEDRTPTWRWLAVVAVGAIGAVLMFVWTSASADTSELQRTVKTHGEKIAGIEAWAHASDTRQERIERTVDRIERKVDELRK